MDVADRYAQGDPRHRTERLRCMLDDVVQRAREDVDRIEDPKAQELFETTAAVCAGLVKAFESYEQQAETAWRR